MQLWLRSSLKLFSHNCIKVLDIAAGRSTIHRNGLCYNCIGFFFEKLVGAAIHATGFLADFGLPLFPKSIFSLSAFRLHDGFLEMSFFLAAASCLSVDFFPYTFEGFPAARLIFTLPNRHLSAGALPEQGPAYPLPI